MNLKSNYFLSNRSKPQNVCIMILLMFKNQATPSKVLFVKLQIQVGFPGGSDGKALPALRETWVRSLGQEDPLEKETATHSNTLAWKISWMEEPGRLQSMGLQRAGHD